jgi:hypothetical protein
VSADDGLSYPIFVAILCNNECINRFETKIFYWIFVRSIGKVGFISSGAMMFFSRSFSESEVALTPTLNLEAAALSETV